MSETSEQPQASETTRARAAAPHVRIPETLPLIPGGSTVMYPQQLMPVLATEQRDIQAISEASTSDAKMVGVFPQKVNDNGGHEGDLCAMGTAAAIVRMAKAPDGTVHAILQGVSRIKLLSLAQQDP